MAASLVLSYRACGANETGTLEGVNAIGVLLKLPTGPAIQVPSCVAVRAASMVRHSSTKGPISA